MAVANEALASSEERPIKFRTRSDLVIREVEYQDDRCWIVKDPVAMKYFRLREPEFVVIEALRESVSWLELKVRLEHRFPGKVLRLESIQQLVVSMHRSGMLISKSPGQANPLTKRREQEARRKWLGILSSLISFRLPGIDPDRFLSWSYPKIRWFFTPWFTAIVVATCLAAIGLVLGNLDQFIARLPNFQRFFATDNLMFMAFVLVFTKTIHELGHGFMCKHFGGECHEMGFMLMVISPAMYCDTSDSWVLPNRWHRIAIGAGGMYVEIFMAALATFVWWYTNPGWLHFFALNIMFLSSLTTIVFNANPLLRYDGYFMLSDYLEIPNLAQKAKLAMISQLRVLCLGMKPVDQNQLPQQRKIAFATYGIASFIYRWLVFIMIFWFVRSLLEPLGLVVVANLIVAISLFGIVGLPLIKLFRFFCFPGRLREVNTRNLAWTLGATAMSLLIVCFLPLPHYVSGYAQILPKDAQQVIIQEPGILTQIHVRPGDYVKSGEVIAVLENDELSFELAQLHGELAKLQNDLIGFTANRSRNIDSERLISETRVQIRNTQAKLSIKQTQVDHLFLRANRDGVVIPPARLALQNVESLGLRTWHDSPLHEKNIGALLNYNVLVCMIAEPDDYEAKLFVEQSNLQLIQPNQPVKLVFESNRTKMMLGSVVSVAQDEVSELPPELSQTLGGPVPVKPTVGGTEMPILKLYELRSSVEDRTLNTACSLAAGTHGLAKIHVGYASLGEMTLRYLRTLINFH